MINEKLDFYVMEASDEEFDTEEVRKLVKRLDELDPIPLPWKSDDNQSYSTENIILSHKRGVYKYGY